MFFGPLNRHVPDNLVSRDLQWLSEDNEVVGTPSDDALLLGTHDEEFDMSGTTSDEAAKIGDDYDDTEHQRNSPSLSRCRFSGSP